MEGEITQQPIVNEIKNKPPLKTLLVLSFFTMIFVVVAAYFVFLNKSEQLLGGGINKSEVKLINGMPKILINGKDKITFINHIYYYTNKDPLTGISEDPYGKGVWLSGVKSQLDEMNRIGANTLFLDIMWSDLVTAETKPADVDGSINFTPLDEATAYAKEKNIYMILDIKYDVFLPTWWKKDNGFPGVVLSSETNKEVAPGVSQPCIPQEKNANHACIPREICAKGDSRCCSKPKEELYCCILDMPEPKPGDAMVSGRSVELTKDGMVKCKIGKNNVTYSKCTECETDSYGWKYHNPGMSSEAFRKDYADFVTALVNRYKENSALVGWGFSLGASGEDTYGPSYIPLRAIYGTLMGEGKMDQIADYSDDAQKKFKVWIKEKYKSDEELQTAWSDKSLTLETIKLPDPKKVFKNNKIEAPFPDDWYTGFFVSLDVLSAQGRDLYDFREKVRDEQRSYFTKLIKDLDKNHVLVYVGTNNDGIYNDKNIDAIFGANHVEYAVNENLESNFIALFGMLNKKHGKANIFGLESAGTVGGMEGKSTDVSKQKEALLNAYKVMKCMGSHLGYVDSFGTDMPTWTETDKEVFKEIASYVPGDNCICEFIKPNTKLIGKSISSLVKTFELEDQYSCKGGDDASQDPPIGKPGGGNPCGDGTCDSYEKANPTACPTDCK